MHAVSKLPCNAAGRGDHRSGSHPREQSRGPGKSAGDEAPVVALNQQEQKDIDARVKRAAAWQQRQQDKLTDQAAAEKAEAEIAAKVRGDVS